ncbi:MAG: hypothetical protein OER95_08735, partial [Acidimicrobiia bacterium]|nr:hypothetical protein [Acidimicrobiia bacterium]
MANWAPPKFTFFKQPDGELLAIDDQGAPLACQPTLTTKDVNGVETVVDPWGNTVTEYQLPPYTIHVDYAPDGKSPLGGVAVDADGVPLPLVPTLRVTGTFFDSNEVGVVLPDGSEARLPPYQGPDKFYIHVASSGTRPEAGTPEFEYVAVDGNGVPLPVQPTMVGDVTNPTDPSSVQVSWFSGSATPEPFEFPQFSVHLQYDPAADRGAAAAKPVPIAIGSDGKPLAIQPDFEIDPTDPSAVIAILPDGQKYDPATYEFPKYHVQLQYPAGTYHSAAAPIPTPIAVDENGVPLPVQPHLEVDPTDHSQVKATSLDGTSTPVEVYHPQKDFYVHIEGSGSEHGAPQFAAVAVDANGVPLPIQPHLEVDPTDPTKVTAVFPDGTSYEPPNIYPPAGEPPEEWPPPPSDETTEEDDAAETDEEATDSEDAATADEEGPESFEADKSYAGVEHEEGPVAQDEDWNEGEAAGTAEEGLLTAGLDSSPADARAEAVRTDEESGLARTEQTEPPETDELPVAEPVELLVEGLTPAGDDEISATPITLPGQARDDDEISATPITLPGQTRNDDEISATPITLPGQTRNDDE